MGTSIKPTLRAVEVDTRHTFADAVGEILGLSDAASKLTNDVTIDLLPSGAVLRAEVHFLLTRAQVDVLLSAMP